MEEIRKALYTQKLSAKGFDNQDASDALQTIGWRAWNEVKIDVSMGHGQMPYEIKIVPRPKFGVPNEPKPKMDLVARLQRFDEIHINTAQTLELFPGDPE